MAYAFLLSSSHATPKTHTIINQTGQVVSLTDFIAQLAQADYVILGEYHDSVPQHDAAYWLLNTLHQQRPQGSLLLEMLTVEQQPLIDKINGRPPKDTRLAKALKWQSSWRWDLYGKIVQHPLHNQYRLIATNLTKTETRTLMQGADPLKGYVSTTDNIKIVLKNRILNAHGFNQHAISPEDDRIVDNMVSVQQFRDRRMAEKILTSPKPALLLTGNYHAQKQVGVPMHLIDLQYNKTPLNGVVVLMSKNFSEFDKADADFIWVIEE